MCTPSLAPKIGDLPKTLGFFAVSLGIILPSFNRDCIGIVYKLHSFNWVVVSNMCLFSPRNAGVS